MLTDKKIGFIGSGNMAEALIRGLIGSKTAKPENILCSDIRKEHLAALAGRYGIETTTDNLKVVADAEIIIYAVKPQIFASVLSETADGLDLSKLVISIAAGVPMEAIESCLKKDLRLIRVMPNVCVSVNEGAAGIAAGKFTTEEDVQLAMAIFNAVGKSVYLGDNYLLDAVTGLSGSGPAYVFMIADALADGGVKAGLTKQDALLLAAQTLMGAAKMLLETGEHPGRLKDTVTSPGGTTIAGLHALEKSGVRAALIDAVEAATNRGTELGAIVKKKFASQA